MEEKTCETKECTGERKYRVYWPGQTVELCLACSGRAMGAAAAMGFDISVEPISAPTSGPFCEIHPGGCP